MCSSHEEAVLDFDLNFLHPSDSRTVLQNKNDVKRSVTFTKKRIISVDLLIKRYQRIKDEVEVTHKNFESSQEELKQKCLDHTKGLDTISALENEILLLQNKNKELSEQCFQMDNRLDATKSHTNQLQALIKEKENSIKSLIEQHSKAKSITKKCEKKLLLLEKENATLIKHMTYAKDIFGKTKLQKSHKILFKKYNKFKSENNVGTIFETEESCDDNDCDDVPLSPFYDDSEIKSLNCNQIIKSPDTTTDIKPQNNVHIFSSHKNRENDFNLGSMDTGRGSSLALTDSDKDSHSRDSFINDIPLNDVSENIHIKKFVDNTTSPLHFNTSIDIATSPIQFDEDIPRNKNICDVNQSIELSSKETSNVVMVEHATSPISFYKYTEKAVSPISILNKSVATSPIKIHVEDSNIDDQRKETQQVKQCLEVNSDRHLRDETDAEIEVILNTMRMDRELITPIAKTPMKTHPKKTEVFLSSKQIKHLSSSVTRDVVGLIREDNNQMKANISELANQVQSLMSMLKVNSGYKNNQNNTLNSNDSITHKIRNTILDNAGDYESHNIINQEKSITRHANELETIDNDCSTLQIPPTSKTYSNISLDTKSVTIKKITNGANTNDSYSELGISSDCYYSISSQDRGRKSEGIYHNRLDIGETENINICSKLQTLFKKPCSTSSIITTVVENDLNGVNINERIDMDRGPKLRILSDYHYYPILSNDKENKKEETEHNKVDVNYLQRENSCTKSQIPQNSPCPILYQNTVIENESCINENSIIVEIAETDHDNNTKEQYLQNEDQMVEKNMLEMRSPIVRCEKLDIIQLAYIQNSPEKETQPQREFRKTPKSKKLTKLHKFKRNILPKYKIKSDVSKPLKKTHVKPILPKKKVVTDLDSSATLNDIHVYEKAVEVMAALKSKQKSETSQNIKVLRSNKQRESIHVDNKENSKDVDQIETELVAESKQDLNKSTTRSCTKYNGKNNSNLKTDTDVDQDDVVLSELFNIKDQSIVNKPVLQETRKRRRTTTEENISFPVKRMLRSSVNSNEIESHSNKVISAPNEKTVTKSPTTKETEKYDSNTVKNAVVNPKQSLLCMMIERHGVQSVKYCQTKQSASITDSIAKTLEDEISNIAHLPNVATKSAMNKLLEVIEKWDTKHFLIGLMKYLQDPGRKRELFKTHELPPAPSMTKSEQILLYIVIQLNNSQSNSVDRILSSMEYTLFALNRTPNFEVIESMSHFYAIICRYFSLKSRLRLFMLDAMYCMQYKSITLIKQCLDVWTHILPLAHMGIAKTPLVTCLVYLLHFYKCEDKSNRVRDMRIILNRNYFYKFKDWNEAHILDMFRNAIKDLKGSKKGASVERKMLRMALIILAKRQGTKWCQNNIIKKLLQPIIENNKMPEYAREFCICLLGPLMKPYPIDMKVHCEVVMNQLFNMLQDKQSRNMKEAIMISLIYMNRHNQTRVVEALVSWSPQNVSCEFEEIVKAFVKTKPIKGWKTTLARIPV